MTDTSTSVEAEPAPPAAPARAFQSDALKRLLEAAAAREQAPTPSPVEPELPPAAGLQAAEPSPDYVAPTAAPGRQPMPLALAIAFVAFVSAVAIWLLLFSN